MQPNCQIQNEQLSGQSESDILISGDYHPPMWVKVPVEDHHSGGGNAGRNPAASTSSLAPIRSRYAGAQGQITCIGFPWGRGVRKRFGFIPKGVSRFLDDDCTTMAAALAYYTTFSIAPLLLI